MAEWQLFPEGTIPEHATPAWYAQRCRAPHLEEGAHQPRLHAAADLVGLAIDQGGTSVVDLGAGDGGLLTLLRARGVDAWGYDLQPTNITGACDRGVDVRLLDVLNDPVEWADIAVATEVIEHLVDPHGFVHTVADHARFLVASSPRLETAESHYAFHLWAWDMDGYRQLLTDAGFEVLVHGEAGEFQVILGERRA